MRKRNKEKKKRKTERRGERGRKEKKKREIVCDISTFISNMLKHLYYSQSLQCE